MHLRINKKENIRGKVVIARAEDKMIKSTIIWFDHVRRRTIDP